MQGCDQPMLEGDEPVGSKLAASSFGYGGIVRDQGRKKSTKAVNGAR